MAVNALRREASSAGTAPARHVRVLVVGAGFAGIGVGVALAREGVDYLVLERSQDVGGTWRANRYPGCQCDVPSHLYSFSFAPNPDWSRTYSPQPEIWEYLRSVADRYGVTRRVLFGHEVLDASWDDAQQRWVVVTSGGLFTCDVLVSGIGGLSEPLTPEFSGLESFAGEVFHSADWDSSVSLAGKRVAVIGTGASAVQLVPKIQPEVAHLSVFQRTPGWVLPHRDRPIRDWERSLYRRVPPAQRAVRWGVYWLRELIVIPLAKQPRRAAAIRRLALRHLEAQVPDPELRARLTPSYEPGCKRLLPSNDFYPALTQPNVSLVTSAIDSIGPRGIVTADGEEHPVDVIVMATGFRVTSHPYFERVRGRDGRSLADVWAEKGMQAYRGTTVSGFPNLFVMTGPNTGLGHTSVVVMIEAQIPYLLGALRTLTREGAAAVDVRPEVQADYNRRIQVGLKGTIWNTGGCASWYLDRLGRNTTLWPDFTWKYKLMMRRFDVASYDLVPRKTKRPSGAAARPLTA